jgi:hypothetical protein
LRWKSSERQMKNKTRSEQNLPRFCGTCIFIALIIIINFYISMMFNFVVLFVYYINTFLTAISNKLSCLLVLFYIILVSISILCVIDFWTTNCGFYILPNIASFSGRGTFNIDWGTALQIEYSFIQHFRYYNYLHVWSYIFGNRFP